MVLPMLQIMLLLYCKLMLLLLQRSVVVVNVVDHCVTLADRGVIAISHCVIVVCRGVGRRTGRGFSSVG